MSSSDSIHCATHYPVSLVSLTRCSSMPFVFILSAQKCVEQDRAGYETMKHVAALKHQSVFFIFIFFGCARSLLLHRLSPAAVNGSYSLVSVHRHLTAVASLGAEHGF